MTLFLVRLSHDVMILTAHDREHAKNVAQRYIGGDPETYIVTPRTMPGDLVKIAVTMSDVCIGTPGVYQPKGN